MSERRKHKRNRVKIAIGMQADSSAAVPVTMNDVSWGGAFINTSQAPRVDSVVQIVVTRDDQAPLSLPARVCWTDDDGIGVAWGTLGERERSFIHSILVLE
jgi:hypothetical protein